MARGLSSVFLCCTQYVMREELPLQLRLTVCYMSTAVVQITMHGVYRIDEYQQYVCRSECMGSADLMSITSDDDGMVEHVVHEGGAVKR